MRPDRRCGTSRRRTRSAFAVWVVLVAVRHVRPADARSRRRRRRHRSRRPSSTMRISGPPPGPPSPACAAPAAADCSPSGARPRSCRTPRSPARRTRSSSAITVGGSGADDERMNRKRDAAGSPSALPGARAESPGASSARRCTRSARTRPSTRRTWRRRIPASRRRFAPAAQRRQQRRDQPVDVEERHHVEAAVVGVERAACRRCCER